MKNRFILYAISLLLTCSLQAQSLVEFQSIAIENNPGIQSSYKQFEASLQQIPQAKSLVDPVLSGSYFLRPMRTLMGEQIFKLSLNQQFPWFGTLKAKGNAVALRTEANFQSFLNKKAELERRVAETYYPLIEVEVFLDIEEEHIKLLNSIYELAENQYENNQLKLKDLFEIEIQLEESKTNTEVLKKRKTSLHAQMNALLNRSLENSIQISTEIETTNLMPSEASVEQHPLFKSLQLQEESYQAEEQFSRKSAYPKIGLGVEYVYMDQFSQNGMQFGGMQMFMPMLSVSLPIFNKKYKAAIQETQLMQEAIELEKQNQYNQLNAEYSRYKAEMESEQELLKLLAFKVKKTQQILDLSYNEFENALISLTDLLVVQQRLLNFQQEQQISITALKTAETQLNYLTYKNID